MQQETIFQIYEQNYDSLIRHAFSITGRVWLAEEAVQDLMVSLLQACPDFKNEAHCRNYLFRAVRNLSVNLAAREARAAPIGDAYLFVEDQTAEDENFALRDWIERVLAGEDAEIRDAFIRYILYEERIVDLAKELHMKPNTLTQRFRRICMAIKSEATLTLLHMMFTLLH